MLEQGGFDAVIGGACCDEEKLCVKECVFSFCNVCHRWDLKNQRLELWNFYNVRTKLGESVCVFLFFNWIELDVWLYIYCEKISVVLLYFVVFCLVVACDGVWIMVDDVCLLLYLGETSQLCLVCFCMLGCYLFIGAIEFSVDMLEAVATAQIP